MKISAKLLKHLEKAKVKYTVLEHRTVYTAYDLAATLKKKLEEVAKAVLVVADRKHYIVVLPGHRRVDLKKLQKFLKAKKIAMAKESVQKTLLKIRRGGMAPFGALYKNIPVLTDKALLKTKKVLVATGSYEHSLRMSAKEFLKGAQATVTDLSEKAKKIAKKKSRQ